MRISSNNNGQLNIFKWRSDSGTEPIPLSLPKLFNIDKLNAVYENSAKIIDNREGIIFVLLL